MEHCGLKTTLGITSQFYNGFLTLHFKSNPVLTQISHIVVFETYLRYPTVRDRNPCKKGEYSQPEEK